MPRRSRAPSSAAPADGQTQAAPAAPGAAEESAPRALGFDRWLGFLTSFVAPLTFFTGLLFYFGYVSSRSYFSYFGVDVDLLGLSTQEFVMRSPAALFIPVTILLLIAAVLILLHRLVRRWLTRGTVRRRRAVVRTFAVAGAALIVAGIVAAFLLPVLGDWPYYPFLTPFLLAAGSGLAAYAASTARVYAKAAQGRSVVVLLVVIMVASTFWTTATVAEWWGRGEARTTASDLTELPAVVLDTSERLFPGDDAIRFSQLDTAGDDQALFKYRYFGLRLLVRGGERLFLVPDRWSPDASTIVIPYDDSVRLRFRFFPDANAPTGP